MRFSLRPALVALSAGALLVTACSSGSDAAPSETPPRVEAEAVGSFNDADVLFVQGMIPHHRAAVEMADMALAPGAQAGAEIQALASQIKSAQDPEIEQMTNLLGSWDQSIDMAGMDDMALMDGMMTDEEMAALSSSSGPDFDVAWASAMIVHHEGALSMARTVKSTGSNPDVLTLADATIVGQQAEIDQMRALTGN